MNGITKFLSASLNLNVLELVNLVSYVPKASCSAARNRAANRRQTVNGGCAMNGAFAAPVWNKAGFWSAGIFATIALWNAL